MMKDTRTRTSNTWNAPSLSVKSDLLPTWCPIPLNKLKPIAINLWALCCSLVVQAQTGLPDGSADQPLAEARQITQSYNVDFVPDPSGPRSVMTSMVAGRQQLLLLDEQAGRWVQLTTDTADHTDPAWSPDGLYLAFVHAQGENRRICVMRPDGQGRQFITPSRIRAIHPSWTPDGTRILFSTDDDLQPPAKNDSEILAVNITTLHMDTLITGGVNTYPVMSPDGKRIAFRRIVGDMNSEVFVANADGSDPRNLTRNPSYEGWPAWSPDGKHLAFAANRNGRDHQVFVMNPDGTEVRLLADTHGRGTAPKWAPDGNAIFFTNCAPLENGGGCEVFYAAYRMHPSDTNGTAITIGPDGMQNTASNVVLHEPGVENAYPRLSADGKRILYQSNRTGKWQLYIMDIATGTQQPITHDAHNNNFVDWSADNVWVAFVSDRDGNEEIYRMRTENGQPERLTNDPGRDIHPYFSPDGRYLLFNSTRGNGSLDLYRMELATGEVLRLTDTRMDETCARYSPDMQHIVFLRNDAARDDVAILDLSTGLVENLTKTPQITDGWPMYSADGRWIYYSTMASGQHSIHRVHPDGTGDETITRAAPGEEDGRAYIHRDGHTLIYNKRKNGAIDIRSIQLEN